MPTTASGRGRVLGMGEWADDDLITDVEWPIPAAALVVNDWFWTGAPDPIQIPWTWLTVPMSLRQDQPINAAQITGLSGQVALASAAASQAAYGVFPAAGTLTTILAADAANFANFLVTYYANPLVRSPAWTFDLTGVQFLADENRWRILGRELGDRATLVESTLVDPNGTTITLPVPAGLPPAVTSLTIEGISHQSSPTTRTVTWTTGSLLGPTPAVQGPWFRLDYSTLDGPDAVPF